MLYGFESHMHDDKTHVRICIKLFYTIASSDFEIPYSRIGINYRKEATIRALESKMKHGLLSKNPNTNDLSD